MKIVIISNTRFGYKNKDNEQISYFNDIFIPEIKKTLKKDDIIIHYGNILNNKTSVNLKLFKKIHDIFNEISKICNVYIIKTPHDIDILPFFNNINIVDSDIKIKNILITNNDNISTRDIDYLFFNYEYDKLKHNYKDIKYGFGYLKDNDNNIINIPPPYPFNKNDKSFGYYILDTDTDNITFIQNKYNQSYVELTINDESELKLLDIHKNDLIHLTINKDILNKKEVNMFLSNYNIVDIQYDTELITNVEFSYTNNDIKQSLRDYINKNSPELIDEMDKVFRIHQITI